MTLEGRTIAMLLILAAAAGAADERSGADVGARTVIGEKNPDLADGARLILAGDVAEGMRRTQLGIEAAQTRRERVAGFSNLCAGYIRLDQPATALDYCDQALALDGRHWRARCNRAVAYILLARPDAADADLRVAEAVAPGASSVRHARGMWRDATDPVVPTIVIDDRRGAAAGREPATEDGDG
jgi:hypothetical protein